MNRKRQHPRLTGDRRSGQWLGRLRNATLAWTGLWLFAGGTLVIPAIHNFDHRDDHTHGPSGLELHEHSHRPADPVSLGEPGAARHLPVTKLGHTSAPSHGHGAPAHFGLSLTPTPTFLVPPPSTDLRDRAPPVVADALVPRERREVKVARGPPGAGSRSDTFTNRG